jgi:putative oxidoreductase
MRTVFLWVLTVASAALFVLAGTLKLAGVDMEVQLFATIGIGQWFRYLTGLLEISGAVGLFVPALASYAALMLAVVMSGAVMTDLFIAHESPVAAACLLASTLTIAWLRRERISSARAVAV